MVAGARWTGERGGSSQTGPSPRIHRYLEGYENTANAAVTMLTR